MNELASTDSADDLLTTEQVMEILIADANLSRRAATCVLPGVCVGGRTYFRRRDLEAWQDRQTPNAMTS